MTRGSWKTRSPTSSKPSPRPASSVELEYLASPLPLYPVTPDLATVIEADNVSDQVKVINLYRSLVAHIQGREQDQPHLVSLVDEVEAILQRLRDRQISVELALQQAQEKAEEIVAAEEEQAKSDLPGQSFAFMWVLRGYGVADAEGKAKEIDAILDAYPNWLYSAKLEQAVRLRLFKALKDEVAGDVPRLVEAVDNLLKMHRTVVE
jgi:hypothetical protein